MPESKDDFSRECESDNNDNNDNNDNDESKKPFNC